MSEYVKERQTQHRREYLKKWRAEHQEAVRAAQVRYWTKKAEEMKAAGAIRDNDKPGE